MIDATNVVDSEDVVCSAITSIGMDHMNVLGNSLDEIASDKAGVIKSNVTTVIGPSCKSYKGI